SMRLVEVGRALEQLRPGLAAERIPVDLSGMSGADHPIDVGGGRLERRADGDAMVMGRNNRPAHALSKAGLGCPAACFKGLQPLEQRLTDQRVAEVDPGAVAALGTEEIARQDDLRVALGLEALEF